MPPPLETPDPMAGAAYGGAPAPVQGGFPGGPAPGNYPGSPAQGGYPGGPASGTYPGAPAMPGARCPRACVPSFAVTVD
jgi:hypothetical protein